MKKIIIFAFKFVYPVGESVFLPGFFGFF